MHFLKHVVLAAVVGLMAAPAAAETVRVTGFGESRYEARLDATRQALQSVTRQLVIADRIVENDQIALDKVMTTMNGFIEKFEVVGDRRTDLGFEIQAEVTVSGSLITNYFAESTGSGAAVSGGSMFAEVQRAREQKSVLNEIFTRSFAGYPGEAMAWSVDGVSLSEDRNQVLVEVSLGHSPAFIKALETTLMEIAVNRCTADVNEYLTRMSPNMRFTSEEIDYAKGASYTAGLYIQTMKSCEKSEGAGYRYQNDVCFNGDETVRCYDLPKEIDCEACDFFPQEGLNHVHAPRSGLVFAVFPLDGARNLTSQECLLVDNAVYHGTKFEKDARTRQWGEMGAFEKRAQFPSNRLDLNDRMLKMTLPLSVDSFAIDRTESVEVVPLYYIHHYKYGGLVKGVLADVITGQMVRDENVCGYAAWQLGL